MARAEKKKDGFWEIVKTVFWALVIAMAFRSILYQPFSIPSGSMKPTLLVGDYLFVSKFSYGYSRYSLPFSPDLFDGRVWGSLPERGDVVVFKHPKKDTCSEGPLEMIARTGKWFLGQRTRAPDDCVDYIKRVIGLPGDTVQMKDGILHINGQRVGLERVENFSEPKGTQGERQRLSTCANAPVPQGGVCEIAHYVEELPGGKRHSILDLGRSSVDNTPEFTVKVDHVLFMGDNRDNSVDSRFVNQVGQVPLENLIGRADVIAISSAGAFWEVWKWRLDRLFKSIE
ncbi:MAG: signal peptidase I [Pseudomonadota bacterium]